MIRYSLIFFLFLGYTASAQHSSVLTNYLQKRDSLLKIDSLSYAGKALSLSQEEQLLNRRMKVEQRKLLERYKAGHFFPPARNFYQSKTHIENSPFFSLLRDMPKGGILHLHDMAMGDANWVVETAINTPEMHVYWEQETTEFTPGQLYAYHPGKAPKGFYPAHELADKYPDFRQKLHNLLIFDAQIDEDSVDIWLEFEKIFQRVYGFASYQPIFPDYLYEGLKILIEDHIQHVEVRGKYDNHLYDLDHTHGELAHETLIQLVRQAYRRARKLDPQFTLSLIWANLRFRSQEFIWEDMQKAVSSSVKDPDLIKGYDLVAEEDNGNATLFHAQQFLQLNDLIEQKNKDFGLYLHDGESSWMHVSNLYDAVLLGSRRIGHAFNLFRFPNLMNLVKERDICLEISPLSNQILGYLRDLRLHPGNTYMRRGIPIVISSDDPQIFDYHGLSYDYWSVYMAWELDLADLKRITQNSLQHAALSDREKKQALEVWEQRWDAFVRKQLDTWKTRD